MSYTRVIPRDLFNEASLLKCYGALYIALDDWRGHRATWSNDDLPSFDIVQNEDDGSITIENLTLIAGEHSYRLMRPLNSRQPWPLYAERVDDPDFDPVAVFNDEGALTVDFRNLVSCPVDARAAIHR
jgi:hypothetical protein